MIRLLIIVCLTATTLAMAQVPVVETREADKVSFSFETGIASKYIGERSGKVYTDNSVLQSELTVSFPWFDLGIWNSSSFWRQDGKADGDEIDYTISRTDSIVFIRVEYGASYYDFAKLFSGTEENAVAIFCEISSHVIMSYIFQRVGYSSAVGKAENYVRIERDIMTPRSETEGGTYLTFGTRGFLDMGSFVQIGIDTSVTRDDGVYGVDPDWIFVNKLSFNLADHQGWTFSPNFTFANPLKGKAETVFGLSARTEF